jgi:hypothetical protein
VLNYVLQHDVLGHTSIVCLIKGLRLPHPHSNPQILYGLSIGGAVAIDLASRNPTAVRLPRGSIRAVAKGLSDPRFGGGEHVPLPCKCTSTINTPHLTRLLDQDGPQCFTGTGAVQILRT